ncbi:ABC transporter permease [Silvibacterium dinghuense]|uniref:ABC transporter permease n=1 Tax=Silvibacterium dinghuense TaxID=1560006 RepID=A0A4Q1SGS1_9BACT|nr:ABC transporter permease [Silvibacterium dinghuense]RXS96547.1 ABC transporter permease [Silvibacterium dinghuense]GGG91663.1 ABC transporter permease [Silvibacterium dinghuense]
MRDILLIAKREYLEQVKGKAFKLTTILIPVVFAGLIGVMTFATRNSGVGKHLAIASSDFYLASRVAGQIANDRDAQATVEVVSPATPEQHADLIRKVDQKQIDGFLWIDTSSPNNVKAKYESRSSGDFATESRLHSALNHALVANRLIARGIDTKDVDALTRTVDIDTMQIKNGQEVESSAMGTFWAAYAMALLLTFSVVMYGMNVGRSVIQEKTSRIFEVMLSTVKATDLLAGKLIGIGAVGLTQIAIWGVAGALFAGTALAQSLMTSGGVSIEISPLQIVLFAVYFLLGYLLYSTFFAGIAATCDTEQELQQYAPLAAVPVWLSFGMITFIMSNPNSIWSVAISLFPPCAPIAMFLRLASQFPPAWQIAASLGLLALSVAVVVWFTSRIYRVGILMYGKRATLPEILRWLRYS